MPDINFPVAAAAYVYRNAGSTSNPAQLPKIEQMLRDNADMAYAVSRTPEYNYFLSAGIGSMEDPKQQKSKHGSMNDSIDRTMRETDDVSPKNESKPPLPTSRPDREDVPADGPSAEKRSDGGAPSPSTEQVSEDARPDEDMATLSALMRGAAGMVSKRPAAATSRAVMRNEMKKPMEGEPAVAELVDESDDDITSMDQLQSPDDLQRAPRATNARELPAPDQKRLEGPKNTVADDVDIDDPDSPFTPESPNYQWDGKSWTTGSSDNRPEIKAKSYTIKKNADGSAELIPYTEDRYPQHLNSVKYEGKSYYTNGSEVFNAQTGNVITGRLADEVRRSATMNFEMD